jgi:hypothetical protein
MCFMFSVFIQTRSYTKVGTRHVKLRFFKHIKKKQAENNKFTSFTQNRHENARFSPRAHTKTRQRAEQLI